MLAAGAAASFAFSGSDIVAKFNSWKQEHGKTYPDTEHESRALASFSHNEATIHDHNAGNWTFTLGHNAFSDMTFGEFQGRYMAGGMALFTNKAPKNMERVFLSGEHVPKGYKAPDSLDWVAKGAVTPVKNQAQCGSCWAFSTTGSVEGAYQIANGDLVSLSEEDLVQCDHNGDNGCQGGLMDNAFKFVEKNGIAAESAYGYISGTGIRGLCKPKLEADEVVTVTGFKDVPSGDEDALKTAVALGPVSVAIEADKSVFQLYKSGVLDSAGCGTNLDHGVLVVGYGTHKGIFGSKDYWTVKNSWGPTWGDAGYIKLARGTTAKPKNMCGVASQASYPTGAKAATKKQLVEQAAH